MKSSILFRCAFKFKEQKMFAYADNVFMLQQGFWLDDNFQYAHGMSQCKYWIPPSQILYIKKEIIKRGE